jgi:hypothetical protein
MEPELAIVALLNELKAIAENIKRVAIALEKDVDESSEGG